jgi:RNA polymerase sigma factor (sigma-70 family)
MVHALKASEDLASTMVAAAATGDVVAFEQIIERHHRDMARVCVLICGGDADLADDAVQAAWSIVWRKLHTLRDPERLRPWLVSIAANEARHLVRNRRATVIEIPVSHTSPDDLSRLDALLDLRTAIRRLDPDDRALLALRHVAGFDSTEIGRAIGMTPSGVRSRLERLLARLRRELDDE